MQEIRNLNHPVVTGICDPNKSRTRQLKYFNQVTIVGTRSPLPPPPPPLKGGVGPPEITFTLSVGKVKFPSLLFVL